jgi:hypothetical protein
MQLGPFLWFLQEQITDIIITLSVGGDEICHMAQKSDVWLTMSLELLARRQRHVLEETKDVPDLPMQL